MNETDKALAEALRVLIENMGAGKDFVLEQAPEVIQQLLLWTAVDALLGIAVCAAYLYGFYRFARWAIPEMGGYKNDLTAGMGMIIGGLFALLALIAAVCNASVLLKVWLAPKVFLLEYAARLM